MKNKLAVLVTIPLMFLLCSWNHDDQAKISRQCNADFEKFVTQQLSKQKMKMINIGNDFFQKDYEVLWGYAAMDSRQLTIEQARSVMVEMIADVVDFMKKRQHFMDYLRYAKPKRLNPDKVPIYPVLGIKVAFWDADVNRPPQPYIADMRFEESLITYYQTNPKDQSLVPYLTETYEDALKKVQLHDSKSEEG